MDKSGLAGSGLGSGVTESPSVQSVGWDPAKSVASRLAIAALIKFFPKSLAVNDRLRVETLFCAVGAVTGFAAQYALRQEGIASGKTKESDMFVIAEAPSGERYYFGDALNAILVPHTRESQSVFSILGGEAMRLGAERAELPDCLEIFERTTQSIGTPCFGVPVFPDGHKSELMPRRAVEIFWPSVLDAFTREPIVPVADFSLVEPRHWPLALAVVGASCMAPMKASLAPSLATKIFMEAAIPMSKIDQSAVQFVGATKH
jgi:hypothetical protein